MSAATTSPPAPGTPRHRRYSREDALEALHACAAELGAPVGVDEYRRWSRGRSRPSFTVVEGRFGSWRAAVAAAGLPARRWGGRDPRYTEASATEALRRAAAELGDPLRATDYRDWASEREAPSLRTLERLFGNWQAAGEAAGVGTYGRGGLTREQIAARAAGVETSEKARR